MCLFLKKSFPKGITTVKIKQASGFLMMMLTMSIYYHLDHDDHGRELSNYLDPTNFSAHFVRSYNILYVSVFIFSSPVSLIFFASIYIFCLSFFHSFIHCVYLSAISKHLYSDQ